MKKFIHSVSAEEWHYDDNADIIGLIAAGIAPQELIAKHLYIPPVPPKKLTIYQRIKKAIFR